MPTALLLLTSLIAATPFIVPFDGPVAHGLITAWLAIGLGVAAVSVRPGEAGHFATVVRLPLVAAVIPAALMVVQLAPLRAVANPAWESVATALGQPVARSISIDAGATLLALVQYLALVAIVLLAAAVGSERGRAERTLTALTGAAAVVALVLVLSDAFAPGLLAWKRLEALDVAALGAVLAAASGDRAWERFETRGSGRALALALGGSTAALAVCCLAVGRSGDPNAVFGLAFGVGVFAAIVVVRRLGLGLIGVVGFAAIAAAVCAAVIVNRLAAGSADPALAFSSAGNDLAATTGRMLADTTWLGAGAGSFARLLATYGHPEPDSAAPSGAAAMMIECGRPLAWALLVLVLTGMAGLLAAAMGRGRDSFYAAAGSAALAVLVSLAFGNAGVLGWGTSIVAGATIGLALAQSRSRIAQ